jgi:hypothetical protein
MREETTMDLEDLRRLAVSLRAAIAAAERSVEQSPAAERMLQRLLALLWTAHDELESVTRSTGEQRP